MSICMKLDNIVFLMQGSAKGVVFLSLCIGNCKIFQQIHFATFDKDATWVILGNLLLTQVFMLVSNLKWSSTQIFFFFYGLHYIKLFKH